MPGINALSEMVDFQQKLLTSSNKLNGTGLYKLIIQVRNIKNTCGSVPTQ